MVHGGSFSGNSGEMPNRSNIYEPPMLKRRTTLTEDKNGIKLSTANLSPLAFRLFPFVIVVSIDGFDLFVSTFINSSVHVSQTLASMYDVNEGCDAWKPAECCALKFESSNNAWNNIWTIFQAVADIWVTLEVYFLTKIRENFTSKCHNHLARNCVHPAGDSSQRD